MLLRLTIVRHRQRFVPGENLYLDMQTLFKIPSDQPNWTSSDDVVKFFKSTATSVAPVTPVNAPTSPGLQPSEQPPQPELQIKFDKVVRGYMVISLDCCW